MDADRSASNAIVSERRVRCALDVAAATWLLEANDLDGAKRVLESALDAVSHDVRARALLAQVLFRKRDFVGASELYERLLDEFRTDLVLTFNLALCHLKSGRPAAAATGFRRILEARPDHARARAWLRVAEASTPAPPGAAVFAEPIAPPVTRPSTRPNRIEELPTTHLPPGTVAAKDASGVVTVRVDERTRWTVRSDALEGYAGSVNREAAERERFARLSGIGLALLSGADSLVVIELRDEDTSVRASTLVAYASTLGVEVADPEIVGEFGEDIVRFSGAGAIVLDARAELTTLPVTLTQATTVRWEHVIGWTGHVVGAPSSGVGADGRPLARFAGNGSLLLAMREEAAKVAAPEPRDSYGRYEVIRKLGAPPAQQTLLARANGPGGFLRKVVLEQRLPADGDPRFLERLAREAHGYALLTHPAIARLYDFLVLDGNPVLVREYVSGVSLARLAESMTARDPQVARTVALYVAHVVLAALAAAHDAREPDTRELAPVVHGDVRAENVLVGWNGDVKLAGFASSRPNAITPTTRGDVRDAVEILVRMLSTEIAPLAFGPDTLGSGLGALDLTGARPEMRRALRAALTGVSGGGALSAADLANLIAAAVDLPAARSLCVDELAVLRESAFGGVSQSSMPPPVVGSGDDSDFFQRFVAPKPSPVPQIVEDDPFPADSPLALVAARPLASPPPVLSELPAAPVAAVPDVAAPLEEPRASLPSLGPYGTPPPVQISSLGPATTRAAPESMAPRRRWGATAAGIAVIALSTGMLSIEAARPSADAASGAGGSVEDLKPHTVAPVVVAPAVSVSAAPSSPSVESAPAASVATETAAAPASAAPDSVSGTLHASARAAQHRIWVDNHVVGEGPGDYVVRCGERVVRVGSRGDETRIQVPCGGTVDLE